MAYNGRRGSSIAEGSALVMVSSYIAWYLFLAGAGGGAFLLGSFVDFALRVSNRSWLRGASAVTDAGLLAGPVLVALGTVFLALDLGAPDQAFRLFLTPSGSLLSAGAWALALFCATAFAAFLMGFSDDGPGLRVAETVVSVFAALLALFVVLYAGVFLSLYPAVPFLIETRSDVKMGIAVIDEDLLRQPKRMLPHAGSDSCSSRRRWQPELPC